MPKRDDDLLILDMIDCCKKIHEYVDGMNYDNFINDSRTLDAVTRNFEVLGEASKYVSLETKMGYSLIEWRKIGDFRNILIHDYFGINYETMWKIIQDELPDQLKFLQKLITELKSR